MLINSGIFSDGKGAVSIVPFFNYDLQHLKNKINTLLLATAWLVLITFLLCIPGNNLPKVGLFNFSQFDKLVHIFMFGMLSFLFCKTTNIKKWFFVIASLCTVYGIAMEFVQENWIPNRSFDVLDIAADAVGSFLVLLILKKC